MEVQNMMDSRELNQYKLIKHKYDMYGVGQNCSSIKRIKIFYQDEQKQYVYSFGETFEINIQKIKDLFQIFQKLDINLFKKESQTILNSNSIQTQMNKEDSRDYQIKIQIQQKQNYNLSDSTASTNSKNQKSLILVSLYKDETLYSTQQVYNKKLTVKQFSSLLEQKYGIFGIRLSYNEQKNFSQVPQNKTFQDLLKNYKNCIQFKISFGIQKPCIHINSQVFVQQKNILKSTFCQKVEKGLLLQSFPLQDSSYQHDKRIKVKKIIHCENKGNQKNKSNDLVHEKDNTNDQLKVFQIMQIFCQPSQYFQDHLIQCHPKAQIVCRFSQKDHRHCLKIFGNVFNPEYDLKQSDYLVRYKAGKFSQHKIAKIKIINKRSEINKKFISLKFQNQNQILLTNGFGIKLNSTIINFSDRMKQLRGYLQNCQSWKVSKIKQQLKKLFQKKGICLKKFQLEYKYTNMDQSKTLSDYYVANNSMVIIKVEQNITKIKILQDQQKYPCWFAGQSRIYFQYDEPYESTLSQMYNQNNMFQPQSKDGYDHKSNDMQKLLIQKIQKKQFPEYIKILFQSGKQLICHPNVHFKCKQNKIKSFRSNDEDKKLKQNDEIIYFSQQYLKVKAISLIKQKRELFRVDIYNDDLKGKALILINQAQVINQQWFIKEQKYQKSFKFDVTWKGETFRFDYCQNKNLTFADCFYSKISNLPKKFIVFSERNILKSADKVQKLTNFLRSQDKYQDITISMSQNIMLFSKKSQQKLQVNQIQRIQYANQNKIQLPQQTLSLYYQKAKNLKDFRSIPNNKVFLVHQKLKFSNFYKCQQTFFWKQFQFASTQQLDQNQNILKEVASPDCTVFQIQTYTAKTINQNLVLILPYVYFYVWSIQTKKIKQGQKIISYQLVKIHQLKSPSFQNNIIIWTDDVPQNNLSYIRDIRQIQNNIDFIQLRSTKATIAWVKQFKNILITNFKHLQIKIISDMVRQQQSLINGKPNYYAGIQLLKQFYREKHFTGNILIFCGDEEKAEQNIAKNKLTKNQYNFSVTEQLETVISYGIFQQVKDFNDLQQDSTYLSSSNLNSINESQIEIGLDSSVSILQDIKSFQ